MRFVVLLVLCCLAWECYSSPIQIVENHEVAAKIKKDQTAGRQAAGAEAAGADDDDDDDDDDDIEDALVDDDDDDDDDDVPAPAPQAAGAAPAAAASDDDDDDDDDYLERIFDDILDEDDDDDDDDVSPSTGVVQQTQQQVSAVSQPAISEPAGATGISEGESPVGLNVDYPNEGEQTVFYDEENGGIDTKVDVQVLNKPLEQAASNLAQKVSAAQQSTNEVANASDDDDDDDDDDDEIGGVLDDDDDDDDDDGEDDLIGDDVIEAKRSRSLERQNSIPEVLTLRYNRFVDGIFGRINKILRQSYDPVRVRLAVGGKQNRLKSTSPHKNNAGIKRKTQANGKRKPKASTPTNQADNKSENQVLSEELQAPNSIPVGIPEKFVTSPEQQDQIAQERTTKIKQKKTAASGAPKPSKGNIKKSSDEKVRKAQGTLYGLASLKRVGNVKVIPEGNNSTIKSKFTLGPLTLKVEKSFKRGTVRNVKSATARTNEMVGRINLRVVDGAATLVSIKVQQPKQVQVESLDNHDRTREFVWKRTPHIAHLVSDKIKAAAKSLLQPARSQVVRQ